jgi:hypothetical protein
MKTITIQQYADLIGFKSDDLNAHENPTLEKIQEYAQDELDWTIWDYPLEEYDYVLNEVHDGNEDELVLVNTEIGIRVCEK